MNLQNVLVLVIYLSVVLLVLEALIWEVWGRGKATVALIEEEAMFGRLQLLGYCDTLHLAQRSHDREESSCLNCLDGCHYWTWRCDL